VQHVIFSSDNITPAINNLSAIEECGNLDFAAAPLAFDNCSGQTIEALALNVFPITESTDIEWVFENDNGDTYTQLQTIVINVPDTIAPTLANYPTEIEVTCLPFAANAPTAIDFCGEEIIGVSNIELPLTDYSYNDIIWIYTNALGNESFAIQELNFEASLTILEVDNLIYISPANQISWYNCITNALIPNETSNIYMPSESGSYYAVVAEDPNCIKRSPCIDFDLTTSNYDAYALNAIQVYPNPTEKNITITLNQYIENGRLELYASDGKRMASKNIENLSSMQLEINGESGMYYVNIYSHDKLLLSKAVFKK